MSRTATLLAVAGLALIGGMVAARSDGPGMRRGGMMGQGMMGHGMMQGQGPGEMRGRMRGRTQATRERRRAFMAGPAQEWMSRSNPLQPTEANLEAGAGIYAARCASCHGADGQGKTETAGTLDIPPTPLPMAAGHAPDGFLAWTLAVGGAPTGGAMPPFRDALDETARWQVILYLRQAIAG